MLSLHRQLIRNTRMRIHASTCALTAAPSPQARVMVTTDAALRQLDESTSVSLPNVSHVVCYEVSPTMKEYAERVRAPPS